MPDPIYSRCGMRCDQCLIYRPNVLANDRRAEICAVFTKVWQGFAPDPATVICDGCASCDENAVLFSPDCKARACVLHKDLAHCGHCAQYPCADFPVEPTKEELHRKIDIEKQWTWQEEALMEAYRCKRNMDAFRAKE